jgi:tape measure domain-containing protein
MFSGLAKNNLLFTISGNDQSAKAVNSFKKNVGGANQVVAQLRNTILAAFSAREIIEAANVMIGVENRMNALTGSATETGIAMDNMRRIASDSRSDFDAVAMLYTRLALATEHLGATQRDVADATQTVANTFIIAGSHAQEANNSARQLAQGLASGALRGDELRSVMENNTILTKMLADGLNMTIGELREFGHAGKLTAETVMPILIQGTKETNEQISKMPMTLGQAGVALRNNFQFMIGDIQKGTEGFSTLSAIVGKFAVSIDLILIPAVVLLTAAIAKATIAMGVFALANPFTAFAIGAVAALTAFYVFRDEIIHGFKIMFHEANIATKKIKLGFLKLFKSINDGFILPIRNAFRGTANFIFTIFNTAIENVNKVIDKLPNKIKDRLGIDNLPKITLLDNLVPEDSELNEKINKTANKIEELSNKVIKKVKRRSILDIFLGRDPNDPDADDGTGFTPLTALEKFLKDAEDGFKKFHSNIKTMQEEMQGVFKKSYDGLTNLTMDFLENGKASFKDFATSVVRELIRIAVQKLIIDRMFTSMGGTISQIRDVASMDNGNFNSLIQGFAGGGYTGNGARAGGIDGKGGFPAILHPQETVIDHAQGQSMGSTVNFNISTVDAAGFDELLASRKGLITSIINNAMNNRGRMGVT